MKQLYGKNLSALTEGINNEMWFGIDSGIMKYDGYSWQTYLFPDTVSIGEITAMIFTGDGLYVGGKHGLLLFNEESWKIILGKSLDIAIWDIKKYENVNQIFFATSKGLLIQNKKNFSLYTTDNIIKRDRISDIYPDFNLVDFKYSKNFFSVVNITLLDNNQLLILYYPDEIVDIDKDPFITSGSRYIIAGINEKTGILSFHGLPADNIPEFGKRAFALNTSNNGVWIVSDDIRYGINIYKNNDWEKIKLMDKFNEADICYSIIEIEDKSVLIGGRGRLYMYKNKQWSIYHFPDVPISSSRIILYKAKNDLIWVGGQYNEMYLLDYSNLKWQTYQDLFFQFSDKGNKWFISKDNKIVVKTKDEWFFYDQSDGLIDAPSIVKMTSKGHIWCAGSHEGYAATAFFDQEKWHKQIHRKLSWNIDRRSVYEDIDGSLWFAGYVDAKQEEGQKGGFLNLKYESFEKLDWIRYSFPHTLYGIGRAKNGKLYSGSYLGFYEFSDSNTWIESPNNYIKIDAISQSPDNMLWIGSRFKGVFRFDGSRNIQYSLKNGLISNTIHCLFAVSDTTVWVSTDKDFSYFDGKMWTNHCFPDKLILDTEGGEISISEGSVWISKFPREWTRRAYFNDFVLENDAPFFSVQYTPDKYPPETRITFFHEEVDQSGNTYISWEGIDYFEVTSADNLYYSYRLNNENWSAFEKKDHQTFIKIPSGIHSFEVKARDTDFNEDLTPAKIFFKVFQPVWKRPWFIGLISIFLYIIIFLLTRISIRNKELFKLYENLKNNSNKLNKANIELKVRQEEILTQNEEIQQQAEELHAQRDALEERNLIIEKTNRNMSILSEFGKKVTSSLSIDAINSMIYEYVSSLMDTSAFGIGLFNQQHNIIEYHSFFEQGEKIPYFKRNVNGNNTFSGWCLTHKKEVIVNDVENDYKKYLTEQPVFQTKLKPSSLIILPLLVENRIIGVVTVNSTSKNAYNINDYNNLQSLASYISIALDNANIYELVKRQNANIKSSIEYAKNIQNSILPAKRTLDKYFKSFVIYKPKDIVSGDFYWFTSANTNSGNYLFAAVVDCTGHGVPGAFMSLIGSRILNEIVNEKKIYNPAQILELLNVSIQVALRQDETNNNDGMDLCLCRVEYKPNNQVEVVFSGAKNPLFYSHLINPEIIRVNGSRKSIGGIRSKRSKMFYENSVIHLQKDDIIYLMSDGYIDQHSPKREKIGTIKFMKLLNEIRKYNLETQKAKLELYLDEHKKNEDQRDDITIFAIKL